MKSVPAHGAAVTAALSAALLTTTMLLAGPAFSQEKIKLEKSDDLPRQTYTIQGAPSALVGSHDAVVALADQVKKNTEDILAKYDIQDRKTLQGLYGTILSIAFLEGDEAKTLEYVEKVRALEDKESKKLTQGLTVHAFFAAQHETNQPAGTPEFRAAFKKNLEAAVKALPWATVADNLEQVRGQAQMISEPVIMGMVQAQFDPAVAKSGYLSGDQAKQLIGVRLALETFLPVKEEIAAVIGAQVDANKTEKADIWGARNVTLEAKPGAPLVPIGIWDTGVDVALFPGHVWTNTKEQVNGKDDDGNGYVDDVNGIAYDKNHDRATELLYPLGDAEAHRADLEGTFKGLEDLQASVNSPEATAFKAKMASMKPEEVSVFLEEATLYTMHAHGTHVAGIALEGNPQAEIVVARLGLDHHLVPVLPTLENTKKAAQEFQDTVNYFKSAGVRVVNMSWGLSEKEFEQDLEKNGVGKDQNERATMARGMFAVARDGLHKAFESAPEILFVAAAGNSDNDVNFDEFIPASFELPNFIVAGAVDQAGDATSFTSFGKTVDVYSNGFEVESFVPGGHKMKLSGTSMASPNVANLAAKLIAIDPALTPPQVIDLIERGSEPRGENGKLHVINPSESVKLLAAMQGSGAGAGSGAH